MIDSSSMISHKECTVFILMSFANRNLFPFSTAFTKDFHVRSWSVFTRRSLRVHHFYDMSSTLTDG